jgi:hypothetical protein
MSYCPFCNNLYSVTRTLPVSTTPIGSDTQEGGKKEESLSATPITLSETSSQKGGVDNINEIISRIKKGMTITPDMVKGIKESDILNSSGYKQLPSKEKDLIFNTIMDNVDVKFKPYENKEVKSPLYFLCKNCGYFEQMKEGTIVASRAPTEIISYQDRTTYRDKIYDKTLPITRRYICPNKDCSSHKDLSKREAIFFRETGTFKVVYVCKTCQTIW